MQSGRKIGLAHLTRDGFIGLGKWTLLANEGKKSAENLKIQR
jgi:hypothetical protein